MQFNCIAAYLRQSLRRGPGHGDITRADTAPCAGHTCSARRRPPLTPPVVYSRPLTSNAGILHSTRGAAGRPGRPGAQQLDRSLAHLRNAAARSHRTPPKGRPHWTRNSLGNATPCRMACGRLVAPLHPKATHTTHLDSLSLANLLGAEREPCVRTSNQILFVTATLHRTWCCVLYHVTCRANDKAKLEHASAKQQRQALARQPGLAPHHNIAILLLLLFVALLQ